MPGKLVLVISEGPMGSSLVAGIVEKLGYLQIPFRDYGLGYCARLGQNGRLLLKEKFLAASEGSLLCSARVGGVNFEARDSSAPSVRARRDILIKKLTHAASAANGLDFSSQYHALRIAIAESLNYKKLPERISGNVELVTGNEKEILSNGLSSLDCVFEDVRAIVMKRDFLGWIESLASQRFGSKQKWKNFLFSDLIHRYGIYYHSIEKFEEKGFMIDFDQIFQPRSNNLVQDLAKFLDDREITIDSKEPLDLFGSLVMYGSATQLADVPGRYFSSFTRAVIKRLMPSCPPSLWRNLNIPKWKSAVVYLFYFFELFRYRILKN
jgi:hypothetical protein